jgi:hypothetical protein
VYPFGYAVFIFVYDGASLPFASAKSGAPSEQSREVLAHQRLRSVTSNKVAMLPVISTKKRQAKACRFFISYSKYLYL